MNLAEINSVLQGGKLYFNDVRDRRDVVRCRVAPREVIEEMLRLAVLRLNLGLQHVRQVANHLEM